MKNSEKYIVLDKEFTSQKKAEESARDILYSDSINTILKENEKEYMLAYFEKFHHEWEFKKGVGIKNICRVQEPIYGKVRAFAIKRIDGSETDISFIISSITGKNLKQKNSSAFRNVIEPQIIEFKSDTFSNKIFVTCPDTGKNLDLKNSHVDHVDPTFDEILKEFAILNNIDLEVNLLVESTDNQTKCELKDTEIANKFFVFHKNIAKLEVVSIPTNLSTRRKKKIKPQS